MMSQLTPDESELDNAWAALHKHSRMAPGPAGHGPEEAGNDLVADVVAALDYHQACEAAAACPAALGPHLTASAFLRMRRNAAGSVPVSRVYDYLARRAAMLQLRQLLQRYTDDGRGSVLSITQLQSFVASVLEPHFAADFSKKAAISCAQYVDISAHKLLFFHGHNGRVCVKDLMASPILAEMLSQQPQSPASQNDGIQLQLVPPATESPSDSGADHPGVTTTAGGQSQSWFAPQTAMSIYNHFQSLDTGGQALLNEEDLHKFGSGRLTMLFISRVIEEHGSSPGTPATAEGDLKGSSGEKGGVLDFHGFLSFLLAWDHRDTPPGLRYLWPVLDLRQRGYISRDDVAVWFREVETLWLQEGLYSSLRVHDVVNEIFDLTAPDDPQRITRSDLARCGAAYTVIGMLCDLTSFWEHDSREALLAEAEQFGSEIEADPQTLALAPA